MAEKTAKPTRKRATITRAKARTEPTIDPAAVAERAYFIYLDEGHSDEFENWLRAERELAAA